MNILVADDHPVVRQGLKRILTDAFDDVEFGEAEGESEVLQLIRSKPWNLLLLDISMPGQSGLEILKQIKHVRPTLPVLILTIHSEDEYALRALRAGVSGYLTKETVPEEMVTAVKKVLRGGRYISESLAEKLAVRLSPGFQELPHESLSDREFYVMQMITSGKNISEIAQKLSLSTKTVSTFRARILQKMGMKTNADLIRYGIKNKLID